MSISKTLFGTLADGSAVDLFTLTNANGMTATITNYGGIIVSLVVPDRAGNFADVILGHATFEGVTQRNSPYFGALIGRVGNRIGEGKFMLNGKAYQIPQNNGGHALHGGNVGFDKKLWQATVLGDTLALTYYSPDGEEGFPGGLTATVNYTLTDANELRIRYNAVTDADTIVNLTNHAYFNFSGAETILEHVLHLNADTFTPYDASLIPTGEIAPVRNTPLDFTQPCAIGARINEPHEQLRRGGGYDHNFVVNGKAGELRLAAHVSEPTSGRTMAVFTTEPSVQFYCGNFLDGSLSGKGRVFGKRSGFCLETQHHPNAINRPNFPSVVLRPGERLDSVTVYRFGVAD